MLFKAIATVADSDRTFFSKSAKRACELAAEYLRSRADFRTQTHRFGIALHQNGEEIAHLQSYPYCVSQYRGDCFRKLFDDIYPAFASNWGHFYHADLNGQQY